MIYRRYGGNAKDILSMPFFDGFELIEYALNEELDEKLYIRWVIGYQQIMSFEDFKHQIGANRETRDNRSAEEILGIVRGIIG